MYERILVGFDGSAPALRALDEAIRVAKAHGAMLRIVHVVDEGLAVAPGVPNANLAESERGLWQRGRSLLDEAGTRARNAGVEADTVLLEEMTHKPGARLIEQALKWPADLIVCGTHGRRGIRRLLLGSDSEYVLRHTPVPLLLVRAT